MKILVVGTGALATFFAARLGRVGHSITMLGTWNAGLDALSTGGARLVDAAGNEHSFPVVATDRPEDCRPAAYALVLVKAWQTERAALQLSKCLAPDGLAVTLQNGLGNREILAQQLGPHRAILGITTTGATLLGPGLVKAGGDGTISIERHPALPVLEAALRSADFSVRVVDDSASLIWGKLVVNAAINPLSAMLQIPNGELLARPSARELMGALAQETARVAAAAGVSLPFDDPVRAAEDVAIATSQNRSSMFQDVRRGAPTEIDAICGAITRTGVAHGVATPVNELCWKLVRALVHAAPVVVPGPRLPQTAPAE